MQMNRRTFLQSAAAAGSIAGLAGCICPCCSRAKTQVAVQLYSVRGLMNDKAGFKKTLKDVKDLGYAGVEFAGYGGYSAAELKAMLDDFGLQRAGTHIGMDTLMPAKIQETIDFNLAYGNRYLMVPWMNSPRNCKDRKGFWKKLAEDLSVAAETAKKSGCYVGYHNHRHEFTERYDGKRPIEFLYEAGIPMELDVGHVKLAKEDPIAWLNRLKGRVPSIHAKPAGGNTIGGKDDANEVSDNAAVNARADIVRYNGWSLQ